MKANSQYLPLIGIVVLSLLSLIVVPLYYVVVISPAFNSAIVKDREVAAGQIAAHINTLFLTMDGRLAFNREVITGAVKKELRLARRDFNLAEIKVFAKDGRVIYSSDKSDIGVINTRPYFVNQVMKGVKFTKMIGKDDRTMEDKAMCRDVVETYVPIMSDGHFDGAFEIYYDVTEARAVNHRLIMNSQYILLLVVIMLIAAVLLVSGRAVRLIKRQQMAEKELLESNAELALLFDLSGIMAGIDKNLENMLINAMARITGFIGLPLLKKGAVFLVHAKTLKLTARLHLQKAAAGEVVVEIGQCLCGRTAVSGEIGIVKHCASHCRCFIHGKAGMEHGHIVLPIKAGSRVLGIFLLYTPVDTALTEHQRLLLLSIARQIAVSIGNLQHFAQISELSMRDPLTRLANRRKMDDFMSKQFELVHRYHKDLSLIMIDIDFFKKYNDTYGHEEGDRALINVALILRQQVRKSDLAVRYGGEEFLLIMPEADCEAASRLAERIRRIVERQTPVRISMGVACYQGDEDTEGLIRRADMALYQAKDDGRNRVIRAIS
ncbi:MAG: GGDEF domain-containing protein [Deltaproteobacteria bacterium]|nr:GGDEF domain-containing protein [Deltaproteobacteria bacterium]